jgi:hypothetical protein
MDEAILEGTFVHDSLSDDALAAIVKQFQKRPAVTEIIQPIVKEADFKSEFKCIPEKTASSFFGRGCHHYNACTAGSEDGLADVDSEIHAAMM